MSTRSGQPHPTGETCHSFPTLLDELAVIVRNTHRARGSEANFHTVTDLNHTQGRALELIELTTNVT